MNEIIVVENELVRVELDPEKVFVNGGLDPLINKISEAVDEEVNGLDPSTEKGRKAYGSVCRKISSSSVFVETGMKNYVAELKAKIKPVDAERIRFVAAMKEIREKADHPRQEWLAKEEAKVAAANAIMKSLNDAVIVFSGTTSEELAKRIEAVEQTDIESLPEEYIANAEKMRDAALTKLYAEHDAVINREAEAAELEKLRVEAAERAEADRKAKEESDRKKREERLKAEAAEAAKREAEEQIRKAEEARIAAEAKAKEEAARAAEAAAEAERKRLEDIEKARLAQEAAVKEAERKAKEEAERKEHERIAAEEQERQKEAKRITNAKHRAKIEREAALSLKAEGFDSATAHAAIKAISSGRIANVQIIY